VSEQAILAFWGLSEAREVRQRSGPTTLVLERGRAPVKIDHVQPPAPGWGLLYCRIAMVQSSSFLTGRLADRVLYASFCCRSQDSYTLIYRFQTFDVADHLLSFPTPQSRNAWFRSTLVVRFLEMVGGGSRADMREVLSLPHILSARVVVRATWVLSLV